MKGIPHDILDYDKSNGDSYRVRECNNCIGMGNSLAVQITRKPDGFLWHCYRCSVSGFVSDTGASPAEVQRVLANAGKEKEDTRPEVVSLPDDYTPSLSAKALVDLYDTGITDEDIKRFDIGWSQAHERIIFPVYKYLLGESGSHATKIIGVLGRKLSDDESDKPKWWSVRQRDIKHPRFIGLPKEILKPKEVVVVEDIPSAIRVSSTGYLSIALLTTYLPYELYPILLGWKVHLWLDADAYGKSIKYQAALGSNGVQANTIYTVEDPKFYTNSEILEAIKYGKIIPKDNAV